MSAEAKARIAEAVKASAARKRLEMGIAPTAPTGEPTRIKPLELVRMKDQQFDPILFEPMATGKIGRAHV